MMDISIHPLTWWFPRPLQTWREMLATSLLAAQPWLMAPAYEAQMVVCLW
jgi:hypothetical protein